MNGEGRRGKRLKSRRKLFKIPQKGTERARDKTHFLPPNSVLSV